MGRVVYDWNGSMFLVVGRRVHSKMEGKNKRSTQPLAPLQVASEFGQKQQLGKLNKTLTCPARQVMFWPKSNVIFV